MKNKIFLSLFTFVINCTGFYQPMTLDLEVPDGPESYQAGWYAGCRSAIGSIPSFRNGAIYKPTFANGQYQDDPLFEKAWQSAFYSCSIHTGTFRGFDSSKSIRSVLE